MGKGAAARAMLPDPKSFPCPEPTRMLWRGGILDNRLRRTDNRHLSLLLRLRSSYVGNVGAFLRSIARTYRGKVGNSKSKDSVGERLW